MLEPQHTPFRLGAKVLIGKAEVTTSRRFGLAGEILPGN
jgi:hypothetical protein